jgi:hypothetical protein
VLSKKVWGVLYIPRRMVGNRSWSVSSSWRTEETRKNIWSG